MNIFYRSFCQFRSLGLIFLSLLVLTACAAPEVSQYDAIQEETTGAQAERAVDAEAAAGSTFNKFFPDSEGGYQVVPAQEKTGFAEYKLKQGDKTLAMLTINDTISLPAAAEKYNSATAQIAGYPSVNQGTTATGILVNGRYQVKVLSRDPEFTQADREAWLEKFDLNGLAQVQSKVTNGGMLKAEQHVAPVLASRPVS